MTEHGDNDGRTRAIRAIRSLLTTVACVAFIWAMALGGVSRRVVWPRFAAKTG